MPNDFIIQNQVRSKEQLLTQMNDYRNHLACTINRIFYVNLSSRKISLLGIKRSFFYSSFEYIIFLSTELQLVFVSQINLLLKTN